MEISDKCLHFLPRIALKLLVLITVRYNQLMVAHSATEIAISAHLFYFSIQFTEFVRYFRDMIFSCAFEFCYLVNLLRL